jgi:hypothetical protein
MLLASGEVIPTTTTTTTTTASSSSGSSSSSSEGVSTVASVLQGKAAAALDAAVHRSVRCRLAISSDGGGRQSGVLQEDIAVLPWVGRLPFDAVQLKVCNV